MNNAYTAQSLAAQGRGPDSMLVHMAPREVAGLQALAMAHGGSLTINPETGLPEAGFLSSILPMVAGAALAATGVGAPMAALMVGGGMTLATGSLQKGLMAGLGAFGGAGLGAGLMGAGAGAAAQAGAASGVTEAALGELGINTALPAGTAGGMAAGSTLADLAASGAAAPQAMSPGMQMLEGAKSAFGSKPGFEQFVQGMGGNKGAIQYGLAALSPMLMAQQGNKIPTATQAPGMIRPYTNDRRPTGGFGTSTSPGARGPLDSSERRWFEGTLTPQTPYAAGSQDYAEGGSISDAIQRALLRNDSGPEAAPNTTSPDFARAYRIGSMANNPQLTDLERGVLQMDGFLPPPPPPSRPPASQPAPARPSPIQRLEDNPYYTMTGDSGDAFRYLMGQQTPRPTTPPPPGPITTMPITPPPGSSFRGEPITSPPTTTPAPTTSTGDPRFAGLPQYTRDPVTGRIVLTHMPTQEERNAAGTGGDPNGVGGDGGGTGGDAGDGAGGAGAGGDGSDGGSGVWARGGQIGGYATGGLGSLGGYSDGGRLLRGPGDGVSDSIPATIGRRQPARLADGEFVLPARIVSEIGNGSTEAGSRKLYAMMDRIQNARRKTTGKNKVAKDTNAEKYLPA